MCYFVICSLYIFFFFVFEITIFFSWKNNQTNLQSNVTQLLSSLSSEIFFTLTQVIFFAYVEGVLILSKILGEF